MRRVLPWMVLGLLGCGIDEHPSRTCESDSDCLTGALCYRGFCVEESCDVGAERVCFDGDPALVDPVAVGSCRQGVATCGEDERFGACLEQVLPRAESCNGEDDDCDARIDELEGTTCATLRPGVCAEGTLVCGEAGATCESITPASDELCNGLDDDCDGEVDEALAGVPCFDEAGEGCVATAEGFACTGTCTTGLTACDGNALTCVGATVAVSAADECTTDGDADCDGAVDEGCPCITGDERTCYGGPAGTAGIGVCLSGQQTCTDGVWGECVGERRPVDESCANAGADDDCNGEVDDIALLGTSCTSEALGACRDGTFACVSESRTCVPAEPSAERCDGIDEDCDGRIDEEQRDCGSTCCGGGACVDLQNDAMNCGACLVRCGGGQICSNGGCCAPGQIFCGGGCRNPQTDRNHCGDCGIECADGGLLGIGREDCVGGACQ